MKKAWKENLRDRGVSEEDAKDRIKHVEEESRQRFRPKVKM